MALSMEKSLNFPPQNTHKFWFVTQNLLRLLAIAATLTAACVMVTDKQTTDVYGIQVDARYSYASAFKFFTVANFVASAFSFLSLLLALLVVLGKTSADGRHYFYLVLHDLIISVFLMAACAAATAIGYVGKYGEARVGWMPICDHFGNFCNRVVVAAALSYLGLILYLILTIVSVRESRCAGA